MRKISFRALLTVSLAVAATVSGAAVADGPGFVGPFALEHSTLVRAGVYMKVRAVRDGEPEERQLACYIDDGIESEAAYCPALDLVLPMHVQQSGEFTSHVGFDLMELEDWAASRGIDLVDVEGETPPPQAAEAYFDWWTMSWFCAVEYEDWAKCESKCGGALASPPSASPTTSGNNPFAEPSCDVTCDCASGEEIIFEDPPAVMPSGF